MIPFAAHEIDGISFLELTMDELNKLLPDKLGIVKKIYRLIQSVSGVYVGCGLIGYYYIIWRMEAQLAS